MLVGNTESIKGKLCDGDLHMSPLIGTNNYFKSERTKLSKVADSLTTSSPCWFTKLSLLAIIPTASVLVSA